jgi:hypothetical protein
VPALSSYLYDLDDAINNYQFRHALPDFHHLPFIQNTSRFHIKNSFEAVTTEFMKMKHIPAYDPGTAILAKIEQLQTTLDALLASQNQFQQRTPSSNFTQLETRMQNLHIT